MGEFKKMMLAYRRFSNDPSYTSKQRIRKGVYEDWIALEQNDKNDSSFGKISRAGIEVVHFIKNGKYYAFRLNGSTFLNGDFIVDFTSLADTVSDYNTLLFRCFNHFEHKTAKIGGIPMDYAYDEDEVVVAVKWFGTRHHSGLSTDKFVRTKV